MKKIKKILFLTLLFSFSFIGFAFADPISFSIFVLGYTITFTLYPIMAAITLAAIGYSLYQQDKMKKRLGQSKYAANEITNTNSNEEIVAIIYGGPHIWGGNIIWQSDPGSVVQRFMGLCVGEISAITNIEVDDNGISNDKVITLETLITQKVIGNQLPILLTPLNTVESDFVLYGQNNAAISTNLYTFNYDTSKAILSAAGYAAAIIEGGGENFKGSYIAKGIDGCSYTAYLGTSSQTVDSRANGVVKGLRDLAYLALTLTAGEKVSSNPTVSCYITGRKIQTWNGSNWTTNPLSASKNPAAIIRDYLLLSSVLGGAGLPQAFVDNTSFGAASQICDQLVDNGIGGTEKRYELDVIIDSKSSALDTLSKFLTTCNMALIRSGATYKIAIEKSGETAVQAFTENNITKGSFTYGYGQADDTPNRVIVEWIESLEPKNPKRQALAEDELDQEVRGVHELKMEAYGVIRQSQASRLAKKILYQKKINDIWCEFESNMSALHCEQFDVVSVTHSRPNWTAALFRIVEIEEAGFGNAKYLLQAYNSSVLDDGFGATFDDWDYGSPPNPFATVTEVSNIQLTEVGWVTGDGTWVSHIDVTWTRPATLFELLDSYIIEIKKDTGGYIPIGGLAKSASSYRTNVSLDIGSTYYIKIKTKSVNGIISDGAVSASLTLLGKDALPNNVSNFANTFTNEIVFTWDKNTDLDLAGYEIRLENANWGVQSANLIYRGLTNTFTIVRPSSRAPGTYYIKAYDTFGNFSATAQSVTPTNAAPGLPTVISTQWFGFAKLEWSDVGDADLQYYEIYKSKTNAWAGEELLEAKVVGTEAIVQGNAPVDATATAVSSTTMTDAAIKDKGADYFIGDIILQTSGAFSGQSATVTAYHTGTGRITVASWPSGTPSIGDKFVIKDRAYFKVRAVDTYGAGTFSSSKTIDFTPLAESELSDQAITARKITTGELITLSAQIKDAIITTAKILSLNADKINVGTLTGFIIQTAASGARVVLTTDYLIAYNSTPTQVFKVYITGASVGDVEIGDYAGGNGMLWDNSAGKFIIKGVLDIGTAGKVYIDGTNEILKVYDASANLRVELGKFT